MYRLEVYVLRDIEPLLATTPGILLTLVLGGCLVGDPSEAEQETEAQSAGSEGGDCVPGQAVACECDDGRPGAQACRDDGDGFDPCACDGSGSGSASGPSSDDGADAGTDGGSDDSTSGGSSDPTDGGETGMPASPSWSKDIVPLLYKGCGAGVDTCHGREAYGANVDFDCRGWLSMEDIPLGAEFYAGPTAGQPTGCPDIPLYDRLLMAPWQCDPSSAYVRPGDPGGSYLLTKIYGDSLCGSPGEFESMPPVDSAFSISDQEIEMLEAWILAGAPFDG